MTVRIETISRRITHKYVGTYRHLDQWEEVGQVKILGTARIYDPYQWEALALRTDSVYGPRSHFSKRRNAWVYPFKRPMRKCERRAKLASFHEDHSDGNTTVLNVIAKGFKGMTQQEVCRAIEDEYSSHGCAHTYDCCGCASYSARCKHTGKGAEFILIIHTSYNY